MSKEKSKLFKQRLFRVHSAVGICVSLLLYLSVFFGIFAIMLPYIQVWEKPSRHFEAANITEINYSAMIDPIISNPDFPKNNIIIELPGNMNDPALIISHKFTDETVFNPKTQEKLDHEGDKSQLAKFLNGMHYGRPLSVIGYTVFGFMAVAVMFLIIGGLILVNVFKYKSNGKNQQSKFSQYHRKIFTWVFPPFIIITLTGALMCVGYSGSGAMTYIASKGETANIERITTPVLVPQEKPIEKKNDNVPMLPISELIKIAQEINPNVTLQELRLINWKDSSARIKLEGYNSHYPFLNGVFNKPTLTLNAIDGSVVSNVKVMDRHWSVLVADATYFLHLLFGVDFTIRIIIAFIMLFSALALGFGVMLWCEKKAKKFEGKIPFYHGVGKLALAIMIGVIPSTAFIFNLQWLLPINLEDRIIWQQGLFFNMWLGALFWAFYRINSYQAAKELLFLGGVLFILAPFNHFLNSGYTPFDLYNQGMHIILNVDIALLLVGCLLILSSLKLPKSRDEAKLFWNKKTTKV
ncbi:PepSY-associated TM helix domain-containing protein [Malaciobacter sp. WC5094]|uniref:PepSY-associated TM helix domain-containing protein n=1 Tax=Arcobacter sp. YIC-80 TaxID=3376683 RepID=UPI00385071A9